MGSTGEALAAEMDCEEQTSRALTSRERRGLVVEATVRTLATVAVLVALLRLAVRPRRQRCHGRADHARVCCPRRGYRWAGSEVGRSPYPGIRVVEALTFTVPAFVLLFATTYFVMAHTVVSSFTESLTRTDALYFSVTTFATVGYGDIAAKSESARLVVTVQMLLDILWLGLVVRRVLEAVKRSHQREAAAQSAGRLLSSTPAPQRTSIWRCG